MKKRLYTNLIAGNLRPRFVTRKCLKKTNSKAICLPERIIQNINGAADKFVEKMKDALAVFVQLEIDDKRAGLEGRQCV